MPLRVAAYCRVSTDREDQANSLHSQQVYFTQYIQARQGWALTEVYADGPVKIGLNPKHLHSKESAGLVLFLFYEHRGRPQMRKTAKITAICNQKGGVGKTVTAVNLGIGLAREGKKVLLVDVDAQGSLTASLGYQHPDQMENTLAAILGRIIMDKPVSPGEGIIHHAEGVDLLPANIELSGVEVTLVNIMSRETILRDHLNKIRDQYDVILLDCCPSLGMLTINALAAADEVLIPAMAHYLSIKGLEQLIRTISNVRQKINPGLKIAGLLITMADMRTTYSREIIDLLHDAHGDKLRIFSSIIPLSIRAAEISAEGKSIYLHDPAGKVAAAYAALTKEVLAS